MRYLHVIGWEKFQHYRNRRAPWIKAYTDVLDALEHPTFTKLTDGAKLTLHHLRLLAGVTGNQIPETWITSGHLNMQTKPRVTELVDAGFVEWEEAASLAGAEENYTAPLASGDRLGGETTAPPRARSRARGRAHSQGSQGLLDSTSPGETKNPQRASARELVENFKVTAKHREWAAENVPGIDVDSATESWRDHFRHNGYKTRAGPLCDADSAWRNWMRNEVKFNRGPNGYRNVKRSDTSATSTRVHAGTASGGSPVPRTGDAAPPRRTAAELGQLSASDILAQRKADG